MRGHDGGIDIDRDQRPIGARSASPAPGPKTAPASTPSNSASTPPRSPAAPGRPVVSLQEDSRRKVQTDAHYAVATLREPAQ